MLKKTQVIELLLRKDKPSYRKISEIVGCDFRYVGRLAAMLGLSKTRPIMDFRGLLSKWKD